MGDYLCGCCGFKMQKSSTSYHISDIFQKWINHGISFSNETLSEYANSENITLYICESCGFGIFIPTIVGTDNFYIDITRDAYYLDDRWDFQVAINLLRALKLNSILDIGCGKGAFLALVSKSCPEAIAYGVDSNPSVKDAFPINAHLFSELQNVPYKMDMITLFQVIEHVKNPFQLLDSCVDRLVEGGYLVISVPDHSGPIKFFSDSHTAIPPHHVSLWTPRSLDNLLDRMDLKIISREAEYLPDYLMSMYLPKIFSNQIGFLDNQLVEGLIRRYLTSPLIWIFKRFGIKRLPLRGHTYLVIAQKQ